MSVHAIANPQAYDVASRWTGHARALCYWSLGTGECRCLGRWRATEMSLLNILRIVDDDAATSCKPGNRKDRDRLG
jgi:hypothetical protein